MLRELPLTILFVSLVGCAVADDECMRIFKTQGERYNGPAIMLSSGDAFFNIPQSQKLCTVLLNGDFNFHEDVRMQYEKSPFEGTVRVLLVDVEGQLRSREGKVHVLDVVRAQSMSPETDPVQADRFFRLHTSEGLQFHEGF